MADHLRPIGFWSYTSSDDTFSLGRLSQLRRLLANALQLMIGKEPVHIFQDVAAIPYGTDWMEQIHKALGESSFLVPIVTPAFLQSDMCCHEVMHFREREQALGRGDLIFPLHYINVDDLDPGRPGDVCDPQALKLLKRRQWVDFRSLRRRDPEGEAVAIALDEVAAAIRLALRRQVPLAASPVVAKPAEPPPVPRPAIVAAPAATVPGTVAREGPDYPEMVLIPAGDFVRGVPDEEEEREAVPKMYRGRSVPLRRVTIAAPFWLGRCPVTRGEFAAFVNDTGYQMADTAWTYEPNDKGEWRYEKRGGRNWRNPGYAQTDRHPAVCVSHADAAAYAEWLSRRTAQQYRLPSEAEWEYAARSGTRTARYWGDGREQACRYANVADRSLMARMQATFDADQFFDGDDGFPFTAPVGSFLPNAFGLHDMLGNVWEWTADTWHDTYNGAPDDGSAWTTGGSDARRVLRGGSWVDDPRILRAGCRDHGVPGYRGGIAGFRLARTSF